jgi:hypothetical protein
MATRRAVDPVPVVVRSVPLSVNRQVDDPKARAPSFRPIQGIRDQAQQLG